MPSDADQANAYCRSRLIRKNDTHEHSCKHPAMHEGRCQCRDEGCTREWIRPDSPDFFSEAQQAARKLARLEAFEDALADIFSSSQSHSEVYYTVEQIVRRATGPLADLIRKASDGIEDGWASRLPKGES